MGLLAFKLVGNLKRWLLMYEMTKHSFPIASETWLILLYSMLLYYDLGYDQFGVSRKGPEDTSDEHCTIFFDKEKVLYLFVGPIWLSFLILFVKRLVLPVCLNATFILNEGRAARRWNLLVVRVTFCAWK